MRRSLAAVLLVLGCDGGSRVVEPTLRFSRLDDAAIERLARASIGDDANHAILLVDDLQRYAGGICPIVEIDGDTTTIGGYCTASYYPGSSYVITGAVRITRGTHYRFGDFVLEGFAPTNEGPGTYNGTIDPDHSIEIDLVVDKQFGVVRSVLSIDRTLGTRALIGGIELVGSGGALVSGSITTQTGDFLLDGTGTWALEGDDALDVTLDVGCGTWQIRGTQRRGTFSCQR